jgi:hypothetical protein
MAETSEHIHKFERAGLGKAPFRLIGCERKVGPINLGDGRMVGAPGQPMGSCDYCGQGIANCFKIMSADGKTFKVGSDCVEKTGDAGLRAIVQREANEFKRKARHERDEKRIAAAVARLPEATDALKAKPHPVASMAVKGATLHGWVEWMLAYAGTSGKIRAAKAIEAALEQK